MWGHRNRVAWNALDNVARCVSATQVSPAGYIMLEVLRNSFVRWLESAARDEAVGLGLLELVVMQLRRAYFLQVRTLLELYTKRIHFKKYG